MRARRSRWLRMMPRVVGAVALLAASAGLASARAVDSTGVEWQHIPALEVRGYDIRQIAPGLLAVGASGLSRGKRVVKVNWWPCLREKS